MTTRTSSAPVADTGDVATFNCRHGPWRRSQPLLRRWLLFSEFLHEKVIMGSKMGFLARLALRLFALPFLAVGLKTHDSRYAFGYAYLCEKETES